MKRRLQRSLERVLLSTAAALAWNAAVGAAAPPRPALEQLDRETRELYAQIQSAGVRLQLPSPRWIEQLSPEGGLLQKYGNLEPDVRKRLEELSRRLPSSFRPPPDGERILAVPPPGSPEAPLVGGLRLDPLPGPPSDFQPNQVGLLIDDKGDVLVPIFLEREDCQGGVVRAAGRDGRVVEAKFVGSDRQTNLTVLRLAESIGDPLPFNGGKPYAARPPSGALVLYVGFHDGAGRLGLWPESGQAVGFCFFTDGRLAGAARFGQFLSAGACRLIADQIIENGGVRRVALGMWVRELRGEDASRRRPAESNARSLMRVEAVRRGSIAEAAGIQRGDIVLSLGDEPIEDLPTLAAVLTGYAGPQPVKILREGRTLELTVDLARR